MRTMRVEGPRAGGSAQGLSFVQNRAHALLRQAGLGSVVAAGARAGALALQSDVNVPPQTTTDWGGVIEKTLSTIMGGAAAIAQARNQSTPSAGGTIPAPAPGSASNDAMVQTLLMQNQQDSARREQQAAETRRLLMYGGLGLGVLVAGVLLLRR